MPFLSNETNELRTLNSYERNIITFTIITSFFSSFNFIVYLYFQDIITSAFFPETSPEWIKFIGWLGIIIASYLSRPLGGMIIADFGDRLGRKPIFLLSLIITALAALAIAILPTFAQIGIIAPVLLIIIRLIQGLAFGGEVSTSWVFLTEHMPRNYLGMMCGLLVGAFILSTLFSSSIFIFLSSVLTLEQMNLYGWRIPFLIGSLGIFSMILLRYKLGETQPWITAKHQQKLIKYRPLYVAFQQHSNAILLTLLLSWFNISLFLIILLIIPSLGIYYFKIDNNVMAIANGLGIVFASIGAVIFGYFTDRFNPGKVLTLGCFMVALSGFIFFNQIQNGGEFLLLAYALLGFSLGVLGVIPHICIRLFPVEVRLSGVAFSHNIAYTITGLSTPFLLNYIVSSSSSPLTPTLYVLFICFIGAVLGLYVNQLQHLYQINKLANH